MKNIILATIITVSLTPMDMAALQLGNRGAITTVSRNSAVYNQNFRESTEDTVEAAKNEKHCCSQMNHYDWARFGLKGKVKSLTMKAQNKMSSTVKFSVEGKLEEQNGVPSDKCYKQTKSDSMGRITYLELTKKISEKHETYESQTFKYDGVGRLSASSHNNSKGKKNIVYSYIGNDINPSSVRGYGNQGEKCEYNIEYNYLSTDEQGNWTKRECTNSKNERWTEERAVTYYETSDASKPDSLATKKNGSNFLINYDTPAVYPGGLQALLALIHKKLKYPSSCLKKKIQGRVILRFVIEEDGSIGEIKVVKGLNEDMEKEAIRVIRRLKKFKPATLDGKPTKMWFMMPINFVIE